MLTKFITEVTTTFNPFRRPGRTCRVFLAHLPANARSTMRITTNILPRDSQDRSLLKLKFSRSTRITCFCNSFTMASHHMVHHCWPWTFLEDGMEMQLDAEKMSIKDLMEEVDRHSRLLRRQADLAGSWTFHVLQYSNRGLEHYRSTVWTMTECRARYAIACAVPSQQICSREGSLLSRNAPVHGGMKDLTAGRTVHGTIQGFWNWSLASDILTVGRQSVGGTLKRR